MYFNILIYRDYTAEIFAFSHRIGTPNIDLLELQRALTNYSFFERPDISDLLEDKSLHNKADVGEKRPNTDKTEEMTTEATSNDDLIIRGYIKPTITI